MALFFAAACCAVVPKVGCDTMGMAVGDVLVLVVLSLCLGFSLWRVARFVLFHQRFEKVLDSIVGNCGIGFVGRNLRIRILILIVCWFLLEERDVVDKLLELLMDEIGDEGCLVGRVACSFACQVVLHTIVMFDGHQNFEVLVGFGGFWLCPPKFDCIVEKSSFVNVVVAEAKELGVSDILETIFGEGLAVLELLKEISDWCGWIPLRIH